jgi:mannan endo-1,4-beta-mannosidase
VTRGFRHRAPSLHGPGGCGIRIGVTQPGRHAPLVCWPGMLALAGCVSCSDVVLDATVPARVTGQAEAGGVATDASSSVEAGGAGGAESLDAGAPEAASEVTATFTVDGRFLRDPCGDAMVLRGVNEMIIWSENRDGIPEYAEIARTGANAVRIVWNTEGEAAELAAALSNALAEGMLPVPELHGEQQDFAELAGLVDYWTRSDIVDIITNHQATLVVNIAAGLGSEQVTAEQWESEYSVAIGRMRDAGIRVPIMVDAPAYGQDVDTLQASGPALIAADPLHNILLGLNIWWSDGTAERIHAELLETATLDLPLVIGEVSPFASADCPDTPIDYAAVITEADAMQIGWFAWSWGALPNESCPGNLDMSADGTFEGLTGWGLEVAVTHPSSIANTARRSRVVLGETCD